MAEGATLKDYAIKEAEKARLVELNKRYQQRVTIARQGREAMDRREMARAIASYNRYLSIIAEVKSVKAHELHPRLFDNNKESSEMMLISHVCWDLARIYERSKNLKKEFIRSLNLFVLFTSGKTYQVLNSEMLRRHLQKSSTINKNEYTAAYKSIQTSSRACFVATRCFGEEAREVKALRKFKRRLLALPGGFTVVDCYYRSSPWMISVADRFPRLLPLCRGPLRLLAWPFK
jgi:hypothetical protein